MDGIEFWVYTVFPLVLCIAFVHYAFRYIFSIAWVSVKLLLAVVVYLHVQGIANSYTGATGENVFCIESKLFGLPPGSINVAYSLGFKILKARTYKIAAGVCPDCFTPTDHPHGEDSTFNYVLDVTCSVVNQGTAWVVSFMTAHK
jgi:hypothetical protein